MSTQLLERASSRDARRHATFRLSLITDLATGESIGQLLEAGSKPRCGISQVVASLLEQRAFRVAAPLFVMLPLGLASAVEELTRCAAIFRRRGQRAASLSVVFRVGSDPQALLPLFDACARVGARCVLAGDADVLAELAQDSELGRVAFSPDSESIASAAPHLRAAFLRLCRAARVNRYTIWARGVDSLADLVMCHRVSAHWVSGRTMGGFSTEVLRRPCLQDALLKLAQKEAMRGLDDAALLEADERTALDLATSVASDPEVTDLAVLVRDVALPLSSAKRAATSAERLRMRASTMMAIADCELTRMLRAIAEGEPPRSERFDRCEQSYEEASALLGRADEHAAESQRGSVLARASLELRKQVLRGALEARAQRLARPRRWALSFLVNAA